jgi:Zn-dependent M28 family amino/carboxypeptidase
MEDLGHRHVLLTLAEKEADHKAIFTGLRERLARQGANAPVAEPTPDAVTYVRALLAAFDAEEVGFAGSRHYVRHPALPLDRLAVMVNIDQIGYLGPAGLMVLGSTLDPTLGKAIAQASRPSPLRVQPVPVTSARRWSDQAAFVRAGVPTLFFYGRRTPAYHSRLDTADRIDPAGGAAAARLIYGVLQAMEGWATPNPTPPRG